jgi:hypothetical protein
LQQEAQSLPLQQSGQLVPAAWTDPSTAAKAKAIAVSSDFIRYLSLEISKKERPKKLPGPCKFTPHLAVAESAAPKASLLQTRPQHSSDRLAQRSAMAYPQQTPHATVGISEH